MEDKPIWSAVYSPKSMSQLNTPFVEYFQKQIEKDFDEGTARRVVNFAYNFIAQMDEGQKPESELEQDLATAIYPLLGFYRGFLREKAEPEKILVYLRALWDAAPDEIKFRPFFEVEE